ncbi:MAG: hypothetical protein WD872_04505 [Pirellulaceae bacterium]
MRKLFLSACMSAIVSTSPAWAQEDEPRRPRDGDRERREGERHARPDRPDPKELEARFDRTDANSDGKITREEMPERLRGPFSNALERLGGDSMNKEQFVRFMSFAAQQGDRREGGDRPERGPPPGPPPLVMALDADRDGELSAAEIEGASKALLKLDKNSDGKLTREELRPAGAPDARPGEPRPGREGAARIIEQMRERLKEADANKDGKLSKEEAPDRLKENFDQIDANSDGQIDEAEQRKLYERMRERGGNRPEEERRRERNRDRD